MSRTRILALLVSILAIASAANAQDFRQRFVGKSPCAPELKSGHSDFSLRLDKTQQTTLSYLNLNKRKILLIVQPTGDAEHCGVIRDLVQLTNIDKDFEFRCFDSQAPTDVLVGTAIRKGSTKMITALDAWRIDLERQTFVKIHHKAVCSASGWDGADDGSDMVDAAKTYAEHGMPGRFPATSN